MTRPLLAAPILLLASACPGLEVALDVPWDHAKLDGIEERTGCDLGWVLAPDGGGLEIVTRSFPAAEECLPFRAKIEARGGSGRGRTWSIVQGLIAPGLALTTTTSTQASIHGLPIEAGRFSFTVRVADDLGCVSVRPLVLEVTPARASTARLAASGEIDLPQTTSVHLTDLCHPSSPVSPMPAARTTTTAFSPPAFSSDGALLAFVGDFESTGVGELYAVDATAPGSPGAPAAPRRVHPPLGPSTSPPDGYPRVGAFAWAPAGHVLLYTVLRSRTDGDVFAVDLDRGPGAVPQNLSAALHACMNAPDLDPSVAWSPDGAHAAFFLGSCGARRPDALFIVDVASTSTAARRVDCAPRPIAWRPDSGALFVLQIPTDLVVCNLSEVDVVSLDDSAHPIYLGSSAQAALSHDRARLAYAINNGAPNALQLYAIEVADPRGSAIRVSPTLRDGEHASDPVWSPDSTRIAFASNAGGVEAMYVTDVRTATGAVPHMIHMSAASRSVFGARWTPDGRTLCYEDDRHGVHCADLSQGPGWTSVELSPAPVIGWSIDPRGARVALLQTGGLWLVPLSASPFQGAIPYSLPGFEEILALEPVWTPDARRVLLATSGTSGRLRIRFADTATGAALDLALAIGAVEGTLSVALFGLP